MVGTGSMGSSPRILHIALSSTHLATHYLGTYSTQALSTLVLVWWRFQDCPVGYIKMGNGSGTNLKSGTRHVGDMYLCIQRQRQRQQRAGQGKASTTALGPSAVGDGGDGLWGQGISSLVGVVGNSSSRRGCPAGSRAIQGTEAMPGAFDFDPSLTGGVGLLLCVR